ncbi:NAD(P)H-dependent flavin oxidoreductase [Spelaeicoccus albus]|uniref:Enoyl-[acyl-carrier protein] reductase II n=1 Tax=Spelaeicoccus albus TaxID=1280376 RepID=A0A7Z0AB72_9MICO|nr:nitronate monooxygenase [Spelaeicoccus albus]NYI66976.1 enoyl-[acyl-carrier protein] reductase II [Spelaeicoccus albus]
MNDAISTRFTELVGVKYPIVQAGMSWASSCWELPVAVSNAGGLGVLAAGPMRIPDIKQTIDEIQGRTDRPWAANLPLYRKGVDEAKQVIANAAPPVLVASQGGPKAYLSEFHDVGTKCLHVVGSVTHALKAAEAGVDGLIVVGGEAGGHPPKEMVSTTVLARRIALAVPELPIIASGGFVDGAGLVAALAVGASAAQFGTRFLASTEASVHPAYKQMVLDADVDDTRTVGRDLGVIRAIANDFTAEMEELEVGGASKDARKLRFGSSVLRQAAADGDVAQGKVEAGQSAGLIGSVEDAATIVSSIVSEYRAVVDGLPG